MIYDGDYLMRTPINYRLVTQRKAPEEPELFVSEI